MSYRKRIKELKSRKTDDWNRMSIRWLTEKGIAHQAPYLKKGYRDNCDPNSGKYLGVRDFSFKPKCLKKRIRQGAQQVIKQGLQDIEEDKLEAWYDLLYQDDLGVTSHEYDMDEWLSEVDEYNDYYYDDYGYYH